MRFGKREHGSITIEDFLKLQDKDLQKYIYVRGTINMSTLHIRKDDEEKLGYFMMDRSLKINNQGSFYLKTKCPQYIVYDKKTKKARVSVTNDTVYRIFLKEHLPFIEIWMDRWIPPRATATFCKRVVEGKINTLGDVIQYHKSYTVKRKELDLSTIYKFMTNNDKYLLQVIEDPENANWYEKLDLSTTYLHTKPFKVKIEDVGGVKKRYAEWLHTQSEKYDSLYGCGNEKNGGGAGKSSSREISGLLGEMPF